MIIRALTLVSILTALPSAAGFAASKAKTKKKSNNNQVKVDKKPNEKPSIKPLERAQGLRFGLGGGLQSIYLPSIGLEAVADFGKLQAGGEFGFFQLSQSEFRGNTSFIGLGARWRPNQGQPFFLGASFGMRSVSLTTNADLSYTDGASGNTTNTTIAWTRKVSQSLFYPKAGWMWKADKSALIAAAGLLIPIGSKASISGNPTSAEGISEEDYQATADSKLKDVTKTTNSIMPSVEFKYLLFLN
jgi:hypothetical protein